MAYLRSVSPPLYPHAPPPSRTSPTSPASLASLSSNRSSSERLFIPTSPTDKHENPPFQPREDDQTSLSQVFEPRESPTSIDDIVHALERPNSCRASTAAGDCLRHRTLYQELKAMTQGENRPESSRSSSTPQTANERADEILFSLSSVAASRFTSKRAEDDDLDPLSMPSPRSQATPPDDPFAGLSNEVGMQRAHTHAGIVVPMSIRLRRASSKDFHADDPRASYASTVNPHNTAHPNRPLPVRGPGATTSAPHRTHKSRPASTVLTHTYVHFFLPCPLEENSNVGPADRPVSATLQVVRSRDSIYEVIWQDTDLKDPRNENIIAPPGVSDVQSKQQVPDEEAKTALRSNANGKSMTRWSWEGELEPYPRSGQGTRRPTVIPSLPFRVTSAGRMEHDPVFVCTPLNPIAESPAKMTLESASPSIPFKGHAIVAPGAEHEPQLEPIPRRSSSPRPPPSPYLGGSSLSPQDRKDLLGKRKISNIPPDAGHLKLHRDSLVVAHKRIFHEDLDKAASHVAEALIQGHQSEHGRRPSSKIAEPYANVPDARLAGLQRDLWYASTPPTPTNDVPNTSTEAGKKTEGNDTANDAPKEKKSARSCPVDVKEFSKRADDDCESKMSHRPGPSRNKSAQKVRLVVEYTDSTRDCGTSNKRHKRVAGGQWYEDAQGW